MDTTTNYNLNLPPKGHQNWDILTNQNFDKIDTELKNNANKIGDLSQIPEDDLVAAVQADRESLNDIVTKNVSNTTLKMLNQQAVTIVGYGDSVTFGANPDLSQIANPYPKLLQDRLRYIYGYNNISVINSGMSGSTSNGGKDNIQTKVIANSPDLAIIMFGLNDADQQIPLDTYKNNLRSMVTQCKTNNIEVILMSPTFMMKTGNSSNPNERYQVAQYRETVRQIAQEKNVGFIDINEEFEKLFIKNAIDVRILSDTVHLTQQGYQYIADIIIKEQLTPTLVCELSDNEYLPFNSPYVFNTCTQKVSSSSQKLYYNYILDNTHLNEYIRFLVYISNPKQALYILNYQDSATGQITVKDFGTDLVTLNATGTAATFDVESKITLGIGLHCIEFNSNNLVTGKFAPSGCIIKIENAVAVVNPPTFYNIGIANQGTLEQLAPYSYNTFKLETADSLTVSQAEGMILENLPRFSVINKIVFEMDVLADLNSAVTFCSQSGSSRNKIIFGSNQIQVATNMGTTPLTFTYDITKVNRLRFTLASNGDIVIYINGALVGTVNTGYAKDGYLGMYLTNGAKKISISNIMFVSQ